MASRKADDDMIVSAVNRVLDCEYWLSFGMTERRADRLTKARQSLADCLEYRDFHRALVELPSAHWHGARQAYREAAGRYREPFPPLGFMRWASSTSEVDLRAFPDIGRIGAAAIRAWGRRMWRGSPR